MGRIGKIFAALRARGEAALIPFITAGDPNLAATLKIMRALARGGADCIELGIPFSDPTADGPTIQRSSERALRRPLSIAAILRVVREFRARSEVPVVLFGYFNPIFHYGLEKFARQAAEAGADGVLCVDLPPEESAELQRWTDAAGLDLIFLLAPTSGPERVTLVARRGRGCIYYVSLTGVTGARRSLDHTLRSQVEGVRNVCSLPVGVGFGISTPKQAAWIAEFADAVVVGSALVAKIEKAAGANAKARQAEIFTTQLKRAIRRGARPAGRNRSPKLFIQSPS
jgi:tryptophan synthase alpha chain